MKKTIKFFSLLLAILMAVTGLPISVSAAGVAFTASSSSTDVKAGDIVTVDVILSNNSNLNAVTMNVAYDSDKLEYVSHSVYEVFGNEFVNQEYMDGKIRFVSATGTPVTAGGKILTIQFSVVSSSCSTISLEIEEALDNDINEVATTANSVILHSYGEWTTEIEPLCETTGQKSKACSCGEKLYDIISALGHDYSSDYTIDTEPNCTETGSKSQHCSRCESTTNITEIAPNGHSFGEWIVETEPTCEKVGKENRTCSVCDEIESQDIPITAHTEEVIPAVAPTCTETGLTAGVKCSVCKKILTTQMEISATGHTEEAIPAVAPTCTETGLTTGVKCSVCKEILIAQTTVSATGHNYESEVTIIPTHTDNGERTYTCTLCANTYIEIIEADGDHKHISSVTTKPTCTDKGVLTYNCACGDVYTEDIPALGHTEVTDNAVAPTCTKTGLTAGSHCATCGEVFAAQIVLDALGHTEVVLPAVEPTCLQTGKTEGSMCSVCNKTLVPQYNVGAKGHSYADRVIDEPTCTHKGVGERYCVNCDFVQKVYEIPATDHTDEELDGKCDVCDTTVCFCGCHKTGIAKFFWSIGNFFKKLFGNKAPCTCGKPH